MRKLLILSVAVIVAGALAAGTALGGAPTKAPPVSLQGKVTNKGTKTVKNGKISIEADDFSFKPTFAKATPGSTVTVSLRNKSDTQHSFTIPELGIDQTLGPRQKATMNVTMPASGATNFFCRFHGPSGSNQGMQGALYFREHEVVNPPERETAPSAPTATSATPSATTGSGGGSGGY
jgi:plastocyanin